LDQPLRWKKPMRIFVNSMSDVFHAQFTLAQIRRVFEVMISAHWHQFQVLTKRPERALRLAEALMWGPNIWIGTSIENMKVARRVDALRQISQARIRFVSAEPLLGPLNDLNLDGIDWVIGGGESGPRFRECKEEWAIGLRDNCVAKGVSFFWKQWGGRTPKAGGRRLSGRFWNQYPTAHPYHCARHSA
jgi:protein gp37